MELLEMTDEDFEIIVIEACREVAEIYGVEKKDRKQQQQQHERGQSGVPHGRAGRGHEQEQHPQRAQSWGGARQERLIQGWTAQDWQSWNAGSWQTPGTGAAHGGAGRGRAPRDAFSS